MRILGMRNPVALLLKGLIVSVVWGVIAVGVWMYLGDEWGPKGNTAVFAADLDVYTFDFPFLEPSLGGDVHIRGKAVVVDVTDHVVLPETFDLPPDIAARAPDEVGTVIQVERLLEHVGGYDDQSPAYRQNALVRIVDLGYGCAIGEAFIVGGDPPEEKDGDGPGFGDSPDEQIPALVEGLPRITLDGRPGEAEQTARGGLPAGDTANRFRASPYQGAAATQRDAYGAQDRRTPEAVKHLFIGMTVDEALALLGPPLSRSRIGSGSDRATRCTWQLPEGGTLICRFRTNSLEEWEVQ